MACYHHTRRASRATRRFASAGSSTWLSTEPERSQASQVSHHLVPSRATWSNHVVRLAIAVVIVAGCSGGTSRPTATTVTPLAPTPTASGIKPPVAAKRVVTDTYHGVTIEDPYRWLEADTAEVTAWSDGENRYTRAYLDAIAGRDKLREEIKAIIAAPVTRYFDVSTAGGKLFARRKLPDHEQSQLVVADGPDAMDRASVVIDPAARFDVHTSIDWYVPSPDGTKIAVAISDGGSESGTVSHRRSRPARSSNADPERPARHRRRLRRVDARRQGRSTTRAIRRRASTPTARPFLAAAVLSRARHAARRIATSSARTCRRSPRCNSQSDAQVACSRPCSTATAASFRHYLRDAKGWRQLDRLERSDRLRRVRRTTAICGWCRARTRRAAR